jgi:thiol-disulfide isomerase/thioredoxin
MAGNVSAAIGIHWRSVNFHRQLPILSRKRWIVRRTSLNRILCGFLTLTVFCGIALAQIAERVPQFSTQSLDGRRFNDVSLRGHVVLLEFWATWCPHCRDDQAAVNDIAHRFSSEGLVVLAVDVGEPEKTVRKFLLAHPSSCPVALDENKSLTARFGKHGYPYYVAIDRDGYIAGTQEGAAGEDALVSMLSLAGLDLHSDAPRSKMLRSDASPSDTSRTDASHSDGASPDAPRGAEQGQGSAAAPSGPKIIDVPQASPAPRAARTRPKPAQKTIFVLANGERLESDQYSIEAGILHVTVGGEERAIALNALDLQATKALNRQRGIDLKIPQSRGEVSLSF